MYGISSRQDIKTFAYNFGTLRRTFEEHGPNVKKTGMLCKKPPDELRTEDHETYLKSSPSNPK